MSFDGKLIKASHESISDRGWSMIGQTLPLLHRNRKSESMMSFERGVRGSSCVVRSLGDARLRLHSYSNDISWRRSGVVLVWLKPIPLLSESSGVKSICRYQRALRFRAWDICIYTRSRHHFSKILAGNLANKYLVGVVVVIRVLRREGELGDIHRDTLGARRGFVWCGVWL